MSGEEKKSITLAHSADDRDLSRKLADSALAGGKITTDSLPDGADHDDMVFSLRALEIEREVNQQQLRNSAAQSARLQQRFDRIFGALPAVGLLIDATLCRIEAANAMAMSFFGPAAGGGRSFLNLELPSETADQIQQAIDETRQRGQAVVPVARLWSFSGVEHQSRIQFDLIEPETGGRAQILVQMADLSALPRDREGQMQSWLWLRLMTEGLNAVLPFLVEPGRPPRFRYVSSSFESMWGFPPSVLEAEPWLWRAGIVEADRPLWDALMEPGSTTTLAEFRLTRPDGSLRPVQCRLYPTRDPRFLFGLVLDSHEHGLAELPIPTEVSVDFVNMTSFLLTQQADRAALFREFCARFAKCFSSVGHAAVRIQYNGATHISDLWRDEAKYDRIALLHEGHEAGHVDIQFAGNTLPAHAVSWRGQGLVTLRQEACSVLTRMLQQAIDRL